MAYYHCNNFRTWLNGIGFDESVDKVSVYTRYQAAYFLAETDPDGAEIFFTDGGWYNFDNPTREAAVIAHEYMHIVSEAYHSLDQDDTTNALDETYSDYFSIAYTNQSGWNSDSQILEFCTPGNDVGIRDLNNSYDIDDYNQVDVDNFQGINYYDNSVIISGAFWDFREAGDVSASVVDELILESLNNLGSSPNFYDARDALIAAVISEGYSSYLYDMHDAFDNHGMGWEPGTPTNIQISGQEDENPVISWNTVYNADYYKVYRRKSYYNPGNYSCIATTSNTSYTDTDVYISTKDNSDDNYQYKIKAFNDYGESDYSYVESTWGYMDAPKRLADSKDINSSNKFSLPKDFALSQNYPNPFNPSTTIKFELPDDLFVNISIYNLQGKLIQKLVENNLKAGYHKVRWNAVNQSNGIYIYKMEAGEFTAIRKLTLLK